MKTRLIVFLSLLIGTSLIAAEVSRHWILTVSRKAGWEYFIYRADAGGGSPSLIFYLDENPPVEGFQDIVDFGSTTNLFSYTIQINKVIQNAGNPVSPLLTGRQRPIIRLPVASGRQYEVKYSGRADFGGALLSVTNTPVYGASGIVTIIDDAFDSTEQGRAPFYYGVASNRFYRIVETDPAATNSPARVAR